MGRGGRVGGGGGGGGGANPVLQSRLFRALKIGGPSFYTRDALQKVAMNRGLSVDELLVQLGKQDYEISSSEVIDMLIDEFGLDNFADQCIRKRYSGRKGRKNCESLLQRYNECLEEKDYTCAKVRLKTLKEYCSYLLKEDK